MGVLLMTSARTVCASCRRSSERGRTCTTRLLRGRYCSRRRRLRSRRRSCASSNSSVLRQRSQLVRRGPQYDLIGDHRALARVGIRRVRGAVNLHLEGGFTIAQ